MLFTLKGGGWILLAWGITSCSIHEVITSSHHSWVHDSHKNAEECKFVKYVFNETLISDETYVVISPRHNSLRHIWGPYSITIIIVRNTYGDPSSNSAIQKQEFTCSNLLIYLYLHIKKWMRI